MKQSKSHKKVILPVLAAASFMLSTLSFAGTTPTNPNNSPSNNTGIITAINTVGNKIVALSLAGITAFDNALYQFDQNLLNSLNANAAKQTVASKLLQNTMNTTNNNIKNSFQAMPNAILPTSEGMINAQAIQQQINAQNNLKTKLTVGVPASDTLYSNNPQVIESQYTIGSNYYIGPPKTNDDSYFNIASVLSPTAYTPSQLTAAQDYMAYLTQNYSNSTDGLDLTTLKAKINALKPAQQFITLHSFITSTPYQNYQLSMRSNMATKSVALNNFNYLIAERTPSKTAVSGIYNAQGQAIKNPSPLQVQSYIANHRVDNPKWMQSLQSQSSTTLQRETVVILAEIEHQNYQAHLDRERMLATLSAMQMQGSSVNQMLLKTKSQEVNATIEAIGKTKK